MEMLCKPHLIKWLFYISAFYDGVLGAVFLFCPSFPFHYFNVPLPNHVGYVQFPAAILLIFALIFYKIGTNPLKHKDLIKYGILLKVSYCFLTASYWIAGTLPGMWKPFTICDAVMGILYGLSYCSLQSTEQANTDYVDI